MENEHIVHGVDIREIVPHGRDLSNNKDTNCIEQKNREFKLVRGYYMPESLAKLKFEDCCEVISKRFNAGTLDPVEPTKEGLAFYGGQFIERGGDVGRLFAIKYDNLYEKRWVIHEYAFSKAKTNQ